jgi:glutathione S-transferase
LQRLQTLWSQGLERFGGPFLAGPSFTAVDAFFCPVAFRVQTFALPLSEACGAYVRTLLDLPAMKEWYASALQEPWLEPLHDAHTLAHGQLLADLRRP